MIETGRQIAEMAGDLEINEGTLGNWVNQWKADNPEPEKALSPVERARECCTPHVMVLLPQRTDEETEPGDHDGEKQQTRPRRYPGVGIDARHEDHRNVVGEPDDHQDRVRDQERLGPMIAPRLMEGMNPREG